MTDIKILDQAHHLMMGAFVEKGSALHFTELGAALGLGPEAAKTALHDLVATGIPAWLYPDTDYLASFPPFSNQPTQYRITVDGVQNWYAQWGFEALAVCWLFPGKEVTIDAPCLDCGEPVRVVVRDGEILNAEPEEITGYIDIPFGRWRDNLALSWSRMNLFRSEGHARDWSGFNPKSEAGLLPLDKLMTIFSADFFRRRGRPDYISTFRDAYPQFIATVEKMTGGDPFWKREV